MAGRKVKDYQAIDSAILEILKRHACGRVPVASETIAYQLMIFYGIDRRPRMVRYDLKRLHLQQKVEQCRPVGKYRLSF